MKAKLFLLFFGLLGMVVQAAAKQKTAYEILRSDWSSDVCSSDLQFILVKGGFNGVWL